VKKTFSFLLALVLVLGFSLVAVPMGVVGAATATIYVSQPVQVTSDSHYERGQSIIYDGADYWLFYGRSASVTATYETGGTPGPDTHNYEIYYKKASTVAGLVAATATLLVNADNHNIYLGELSATTDGGTGQVMVYAAVDRDGGYDGDTDCDLIHFATTDNGATWTSLNYTGGSSGCPALPDGSAHHAAVNLGGVLWLAWHESGGWNSICYNGSWSTEKPIAYGSGTGKFYFEGSNLYFVRARDVPQNIYQWNGSFWSPIDSATEFGTYDATIYKIGSDYVCAYSTRVAPKQWIKAKVGNNLSTLLSGPTVTVNITAGGYSGNSWVDMWPTVFTDNSDDTYLFYTSERNPSSPSSEIAGNIWYLEVDWPVTNDHYTYIENAQAQANPGDTINVAVATSTGTGTAWFSTSAGNMTQPAAVATPSGAPTAFPHGMFTFNITGLSDYQEVTLTIELPDPVPVGTKWWKYHNNTWSPMDIGDDDGDNTITVALKDNRTPDDEDGTLGQITDQGGPGSPTVGWETYPVSKVRVLLPWIALFAAIVAGVSLLLLRRRRTQT
jgi:hypothetical protein